MKKMSLMALLVSAALFIGLGATSVFAAEGMKCGAGKCGDSMKKVTKKCGAGKCGDTMKKGASCPDGTKCADKKAKCECPEGNCNCEKTAEKKGATKCGSGKCGK